MNKIMIMPVPKRRKTEEGPNEDKFRHYLQTPKKLNASQQYLFDRLARAQKFDPIFVSGSAGTGKSALLIALRDHWLSQGKCVSVAAYTHLAARNIGGRTCHSLFGFDFDLNLIDRCISIPHYLILDEISMIPEKMLDGIDARLRTTTRKYDQPFGGVNIIAFGDMYQLPPIDTNEPIYMSDVWNTFRLYELTENMRQSEHEFITNLNLLRVGDLNCLPYFNTLVMKQKPKIEDKLRCTSLVSTHREADEINDQCYEAIADKESETVMESTHEMVPWSYKATVFNKDQEKVVFKDKLKVCIGTRVMITHSTQGFCNGDMGTIKYISETAGLGIEREHDSVLSYLLPIKLNFNANTSGKMKQVTGLPITYGWAITIHKAQGMTVKNLIVYPLRVFAPGQAYVALSRSTHSMGLRLVDRLPTNAVCSMFEVTEMYKKMRKFE
ncbi:helicase 2 [Phthorimaea operculella granulovirus]|uniref:Helicase 2 n=1 Tax=Phthorimaea operculella granulovirus TaxID=192584 RepID=Q8JRU6_9BBAC|nr:helicase 2 [Phthorimaea operculella granulovirus]AAM70311.1 helicase 2 [Phthorimaea operculella granulovirus]ANY57502.1 helicase 2 [Phthorimaea operculella granulovirus]QBH65948.1 helicase 2 [Phthorimaea operculella granulovirus]QBH66078.1 helicase 2 [Phthorimaea operculella granulovirus]QBH66208.1 helicase 2 [Phthorimaea operculella granulovirus]